MLTVLSLYIWYISSICLFYSLFVELNRCPHKCHRVCFDPNRPLLFSSLQLGHRWRCVRDTVRRDRVGLGAGLREGGQEESVHPLPGHHVLREPALPLHNGYPHLFQPFLPLNRAKKHSEVNSVCF